MGRMKRAVSGAAILAMMCGSAFGQVADDSFDAVMQEHKDAWSALSAERNLNGETATELNKEIIAKLDVSTLSMEQIQRMLGVNALYGNYDNEALNARVNEFASAYGKDGAMGMLLLVDFNNRQGKRDEAAEVVVKLLDHPALSDVLKSDSVSSLLSAMSQYAQADEGANYEKVAKLVLSLPSDLDEKGVGALRQTVVGLTKVVNDETRSLHNKVLAKAIELTEKQIEGMPEDKAKRLKDSLAFYKGPFARGELIDNPMPQMDVIWASNSEVTSMEAYRGKVLVLDFWATWCGPCISSFPNIKKVNDYYKGYDVAIVGVTSLQGFSVNGPTKERIDCTDNTELEYEEMLKFMEYQENMNWEVVFTEQSCFNPDFGVMGIPHMAMVDPSGKVRHNALHPSGVSFEAKVEMINAMLLEAGLEVPPAQEKAAAGG